MRTLFVIVLSMMIAATASAQYKGGGITTEAAHVTIIRIRG